jgi:hypothetical protein
MRRLVRGDVHVTLSHGGNAPASFLWQEKRWEVQQVVLIWKRQANWWDGEGEQTCFRVAAAASEECAYFELAYDHERRAWMLTRIVD